MEQIAETVLSAWKALGDELQADQSAYRAVYDVAKSGQKLNALFPFVGVAGFAFSKVTEYPYFVDVLISQVDNDAYCVCVTGEGGWAESQVVFEGGAESCAEKANSLLPDDYGLAIEGDRNVWRERLGLSPIPSDEN